MADGTYASLENPALRDVGISARRTPQLPPPKPMGIDIVVSADGHWELDADIFYESFPARLKAQAPRVWFDEYWRVGTRGENSFAEIETITDLPTGLYDLDVRMEHMIAEGIDQEICFPQTVLGFLFHPDLEIREHIYRIYNEYVSHRSRLKGNRFHGVGVCSNWWDPSKVQGAVRQIADLGLKTLMVPISAGKGLDGKDMSYGGPEMDIFWQAVAEVGLPVNFHIGENIKPETRGAMGSLMLQHLAPFRKPLGQMIFGGVFDRHPGLKVVFSEGGISWVPTALQDAEMIYDTHDSFLNPKPLHRPSQYWHQNCYATFQTDMLGLKLIDNVGADRAMWASDYPHTESTFGYNYSAMQQVIDAVSPEAARQILGGTARALYKLD